MNNIEAAISLFSIIVIGLIVAVFVSHGKEEGMRFADCILVSKCDTLAK